MTKGTGNETTEVATPKGGGFVAAKLVVVSGPDEGREAALGERAVVGTDPASDLVLTDSSISHRHVAVTRSEHGFEVTDLGSRNGTFLGGAKLSEAEVPLGAVLTVGRSAIAIQARWHVREVPPSSARAFGELVGESVAMREVFAVLERVAPTDVTVLIEGESGTGKELAARSIHAASARSAEPYVVFDCGSVAATLAESELFGHKKGAFSGAVASREGAFGRANGGTLCLDELGELPLELQPKLLRVLETGEIRPVGSDTVQRVDVRVIAATNRDLHAEVLRGRFRGDLLYRIEVVRVRLPPLRQRPEDIPAVALRLLRDKLPASDAIVGENLARLMGYAWPGNVRELRNVLTRAVALAGAPASFSKLVFNLGPASEMPTTIGQDFPGVSSRVPYKEAKGQLLMSFDRAYLAALLDRHGGNVSHAAASAGLSRKHLYELMRRVERAESGETTPDASTDDPE